MKVDEHVGWVDDALHDKCELVFCEVVLGEEVDLVD